MSPGVKEGEQGQQEQRTEREDQQRSYDVGHEDSEHCSTSIRLLLGWLGGRTNL